MAVVFGALGDSHLIITTLVFCGLLLFLTFIEFSLERLDNYAERHNQQDLFNKLKYELMVLGILSFLLFILDSASIVQQNPNFFHAFEVAHIIVLFIALSFITQAIFLAQYANNAGNSFVPFHND